MDWTDFYNDLARDQGWELEKRKKKMSYRSDDDMDGRKVVTLVLANVGVFVLYVSLALEFGSGLFFGIMFALHFLVNAYLVYKKKLYHND
jgi:hypothetical protein